MKDLKHAQLVRTGTNQSTFNHYFIEYTIDNHFYHERFNFESEMKARLEQIGES